MFTIKTFPTLMPHRRSVLKGAGALGAAAVLPVGMSDAQRGQGVGSVTLVNPDLPYQPGDTITLSVDTTGRVNWVAIGAEKPNANGEYYVFRVDEYVYDSQSSVRLSWTIPEDAPTGEYDFLVDVYEYGTEWNYLDRVEALTLDISDKSGDGGNSEYLSGTIEDVNGRPVPNATVSLFAYDHESLSASFELEEIEKTTTSNDGSYTLEQVPVSEFDQYRQSNSITRMLLVAKSEPDTADRRWFDSEVFPPENLPPDGSFSPLRLSHQVIFHEQVSEPLSSVSVWRTIVDSEQNQQTTDIHICAQGLDGQATTYTQIQNATFSLRVPESLDIEYDSVATGAGWSGETRSDEVLTELAERDTLQNLPVPGVDYSQINSFDADGAAESLSDSRNDFQQSISDAFGFVPYIGTAQGVLTSVTNLLNLDESQIAASIGSGSRYDPNTQDMVNTTVGQKTIAAVSTTRIEISEETEFAARGTWETDSGVIDGPSTPAARLNHEFTVSPSNQGQAISTSTVTTTQQTTSQSQTVQSLPEPEKPPVPAAPTVEQYDQNDDGDISVEELGEAGQDFAADELTIEELAEIGQEFAND